MRETIITAILLLSATGMLLGCGTPDCPDLCDRSADECGEDRDECVRECNAAQDIAEGTGCEDEWEEALCCVDGEDDICSEEEVCSSESNDLQACVEAYCRRNPESEHCFGGL